MVHFSRFQSVFLAPDLMVNDVVNDLRAVLGALRGEGLSLGLESGGIRLRKVWLDHGSRPQPHRILGTVVAGKILLENYGAVEPLPHR